MLSFALFTVNSVNFSMFTTSDLRLVGLRYPCGEHLVLHCPVTSDFSKTCFPQSIWPTVHGDYNIFYIRNWNIIKSSSNSVDLVQVV